jgi:hypothetical protein
MAILYYIGRNYRRLGPHIAEALDIYISELLARVLPSVREPRVCILHEAKLINSNTDERPST